MGHDITVDSFVKKYSKKLNKSIDAIIQEYKMYNLVSFNIMNTDNKIRSMFLKKEQEEKNRIFLQELQHISSKLPRESIIVLFKGIALAYKYYDNPENRWFNDIDLYTDDVEKTVDFLLSIGYQKKEKYNSRYYLYIGECYTPLCKGGFNKLDLNHLEVWKKVDGVHVEIEVHQNILNKIRFPNVDQDAIYRRCQKMNFLDQVNLFGLEEHDLFLYQTCHFSTHLCAYMSYIEKDKFEDIKSIPVRHIHDMVLIMNKSSLNWNTILSRAEEWNIQGCLLTCCKLINLLYGECVDNNIIMQLEKKVKQITERNMHNTFINDISLLNTEKIFYCDFKSCIRENTISKMKPVYNIYQFSENKEIPILISDGNKTLLSAICKWDKSYLYLNIDVKIMSSQFILCITIGAEREILCSDNLFVKVKGAICKVTNIPDNFESNPESWVENVRCKIDGELKEKTKLTLSIPWKALNLVPKHSMRIPFNIRIMYLDENDNLLFRKSLAGKTYYNNYDITSIVLN